MSTGVDDNEGAFPYATAVSRAFQERLSGYWHQEGRINTYELMRLLASDPLKNSVEEGNDHLLRTVDIGKSNFLIFEIIKTRPRPYLLYHDIVAQEKLHLEAEHIREQGPKEKAAFAKIIPDWALSRPKRLDMIMASEKADLLLTPAQRIAAETPLPLLINGRAGSGKTLVLCYCLADRAKKERAPKERMVFLSYNEKLVEQAEMNTSDILLGLQPVPSKLEGIEFLTLRDFLKRYVPDRERFEEGNYLRYGDFKRLYEEEFGMRGRSAIRIPPETVWHGIRSILKGACKPPWSPPLSKEKYRELARKRRDFSEDYFDTIYDIGEWYQSEIIQQSGRFWDDQDLAWEALRWIREKKMNDPDMVLYDGIYCDEVQDLTEIEFLSLTELCGGLNDPTGSLQLLLAGDPLQTINPTGFKWSIVSSDIFTIQGKPVGHCELGENFRSDKKIVDFANEVEKIRSRYLGQGAVLQDAFDQHGDRPLVVEEAVVATVKGVESGQDAAAVSNLKQALGKLGPKDAVIVWPEEKEEVTRLFSTESALGEVDQVIRYSVSEAKGLEFERVVLYKFGSSEAANKWGRFLTKEYQSRPEGTMFDERELIPFQYFLNRLYVAITRAKQFLTLVDTEEGIENFWKKISLTESWEKYLDLLPKETVAKGLLDNPAFKTVFDEDDWRKRGDELLERAEETHDPRDFERAKGSFEHAKDWKMVKLVEAKSAEVEKKFGLAGALYSQIGYDADAALCFEMDEQWEKAYFSYSKLVRTAETEKRLAICRFKWTVEKNAKTAVDEFYKFAMDNGNLEKKSLEQLATTLSELKKHKEATDILQQVGRRFQDNSALVRAAKEAFAQPDMKRSAELFELSKDTNHPEYKLSQAELFLMRGDYAKAIDFFFDNGKHDRVVKVYEDTIKKGTLPVRPIRRRVAQSYVEMRKREEAKKIYEQLFQDSIEKEDWVEALNCLVSELFDKSEAMNMTRNILVATGKSDKNPSENEKAVVMDAVRKFRAYAYWRIELPPEQLGAIHDKYAGPSERADFYFRFTNESWAKEGYIRAMRDLRAEFLDQDDKASRDSASEVERELSRRMKEWRLK